MSHGDAKSWNIFTTEVTEKYYGKDEGSDGYTRINADQRGSGQFHAVDSWLLRTPLLKATGRP